MFSPQQCEYEHRAQLEGTFRIGLFDEDESKSFVIELVVDELEDGEDYNNR